MTFTLLAALLALPAGTQAQLKRATSPAPSFTPLRDSTDIPGIQLEFNGPNALVGEKLVISATTEIRFFRSDNEEVPLSLQVWVDDQVPAAYKAPFRIQSPGTHTVFYRLADPDNSSDTFAISLTTDTQGPVITASIIYKAIRLKQFQFGTAITKKWKPFECPVGSELELRLTDDVGSSENVFLREGKALLKVAGGSIELRSRGSHRYVIVASDLVGNVTQTEPIQLEIREP